MYATTYGLDVAKRVFQMHWVDVETGEIVNRRFGRDELIKFLTQRVAERVALEDQGAWAYNEAGWLAIAMSFTEPQEHCPSVGLPSLQEEATWVTSPASSATCARRPAPLPSPRASRRAFCAAWVSWLHWRPAFPS
jgi:hypothetical protein